jgi:hypothetical protein
VASFAWPLLLQAGGLAELASTRLRLTSHGRAALGAPAHETLRRLCALTAAEPRREIVAGALASCPPGRWVDVDALFRFMQAEARDPQVARDPWKLYRLDPHYGSLGYQGYHDWTLLEGRYVLACCSSTRHRSGSSTWPTRTRSAHATTTTTTGAAMTWACSAVTTACATSG